MLLGPLGEKVALRARHPSWSARMEADEFAESQVRRFLTALFMTRARHLLDRMAELYGWSPATLAEYEMRFITTKTHRFVPVSN